MRAREKEGDWSKALILVSLLVIAVVVFGVITQIVPAVIFPKMAETLSRLAQ